MRKSYRYDGRANGNGHGAYSMRDLEKARSIGRFRQIALELTLVEPRNLDLIKSLAEQLLLKKKHGKDFLARMNTLSSVLETANASDAERFIRTTFHKSRGAVNLD